jgi:hypothetical protein
VGQQTSDAEVDRKATFIWGILCLNLRKISQQAAIVKQAEEGPGRASPAVSAVGAAEQSEDGAEHAEETGAHHAEVFAAIKGY